MFSNGKRFNFPADRMTRKTTSRQRCIPPLPLIFPYFLFRLLRLCKHKQISCASLFAWLSAALPTYLSSRLPASLLPCQPTCLSVHARLFFCVRERGRSLSTRVKTTCVNSANSTRRSSSPMLLISLWSSVNLLPEVKWNSSFPASSLIRFLPQCLASLTTLCSAGFFLFYSHPFRSCYWSTPLCSAILSVSSIYSPALRQDRTLHSTLYFFLLTFSSTPPWLHTRMIRPIPSCRYALFRYSVCFHSRSVQPLSTIATIHHFPISLDLALLLPLPGLLWINSAFPVPNSRALSLLSLSNLTPTLSLVLNFHAHFSSAFLSRSLCLIAHVAPTDPNPFSFSYYSPVPLSFVLVYMLGSFCPQNYRLPPSNCCWCCSFPLGSAFSLSLLLF